MDDNTLTAIFIITLGVVWIGTAFAAALTTRWKSERKDGEE